MNTTGTSDTVAGLAEALHVAKIALAGVVRANQDAQHALEQVNRTLAGIETQENTK